MLAAPAGPVGNSAPTTGAAPGTGGLPPPVRSTYHNQLSTNPSGCWLVATTPTDPGWVLSARPPTTYIALPSLRTAKAVFVVPMPPTRWNDTTGFGGCGNGCSPFGSST